MISIKKYLTRIGASRSLQKQIISFALMNGIKVKRLGDIYLMEEKDILSFCSDVEKINDDDLKNKKDYKYLLRELIKSKRGWRFQN